MNPWVSVKTNELILENPPCVETDIDHVTSFDEDEAITTKRSSVRPSEENHFND